MSARAVALGVGLLFALGACGSEPPAIELRKMQSSVGYSCEGGRRLEALYRAGEPAVTLTLEGQSVTLPQIPAASGIAFSDGVLTFRAKGQQAFTEGRPGGDYVGCVRDN
jgi:membrane-bound inhibitor of C-type lysozyme